MFYHGMVPLKLTFNLLGLTSDKYRLHMTLAVDGMLNTNTKTTSDKHNFIHIMHCIIKNLI